MHSEILHSLPNKRYVRNDKQKTKLMINVLSDAVYYSCKKWNWLIFLDENINKMSYIMLWCSGTILEIENMEQSLFYKLICDPSFVTRTILKKNLFNICCEKTCWNSIIAKFNFVRMSSLRDYEPIMNYIGKSLSNYLNGIKQYISVETVFKL